MEGDGNAGVGVRVRCGCGECVCEWYTWFRCFCLVQVTCL